MTQACEELLTKQAALDGTEYGRIWPIYRDRRGRPMWFQRWLEAWWIITGEWSLHRAWQQGFDGGSHSEYRRLITNKAYLAEINPRALPNDRSWS